MAATKFLICGLLKNAHAVQRCKNIPKASYSGSVCYYSNYRSSPEVSPLQEYPEVVVVRNPPEWKIVERLLPPATVPKPVERQEYPSGWKPPTTLKESEIKYIVARTMNHMLPVYLQTRFRGLRRFTVVRRVQGDIWGLERDLREVVEKARGGRLCASRVNELSGQIHFHGDYVDLVREYLKERGF